MFRSINDLPSHVFFVHVPIVAIPVMGFMAVVMAVLKQPPVWLRRMVLGGMILTLIATWFAVQSGEAFEEVFNGQIKIDRHEELARATLLMVFGLTLAVAALVVVINRGISPAIKAARVGLGAAVVVLAALSTLWTVRTGEEGVRVTWGNIVARDDVAENN